MGKTEIIFLASLLLYGKHVICMNNDNCTSPENKSVDNLALSIDQLTSILHQNNNENLERIARKPKFIGKQV